MCCFSTSLLLKCSNQCSKVSSYTFEYLGQRYLIYSTTVYSLKQDFKQYAEPSRPDIKSLNYENSVTGTLNIGPLNLTKMKRVLLRLNFFFLYPSTLSLTTYHMPETVGLQRWIWATFCLSTESTMVSIGITLQASSLERFTEEKNLQVEMGPMNKGPQQEIWQDRKKANSSLFFVLWI